MAEVGPAARAASIVSTSLWWPGGFPPVSPSAGGACPRGVAASIFLVPLVPGVSSQLI
jgi:hypothetical protein